MLERLCRLLQVMIELVYFGVGNRYMCLTLERGTRRHTHGVTQEALPLLLQVLLVSARGYRASPLRMNRIILNIVVDVQLRLNFLEHLVLRLLIHHLLLLYHGSLLVRGTRMRVSSSRPILLIIILILEHLIFRCATSLPFKRSFELIRCMIHYGRLAILCDKLWEALIRVLLLVHHSYLFVQRRTHYFLLSGSCCWCTIHHLLLILKLVARKIVVNFLRSFLHSELIFK